MTEDVSIPEPGALSVEEAVDLLDAQAADEGDAGAPGASVDGLGEGAVDETEAADEASDGDDRFGPKGWSMEAKARFLELPADLQAVVLEQDEQREAAAARAKQETAEVRRKAAAEHAQVEQLADGLMEVLPEALESFRSRWEGVDWRRAAETFGPEAVQQLQAKYAQDRRQLSRLAAAQAEAARRAHRAFVAAEEEKLAGAEVADPANRAEVARYLLEGGAAPERLNDITAMELIIAHKAMLWDRAQAGLKAPKRAAASSKPVVKPAAGAAQVSPRAREVQAAKSRFAKTRSVEDAIAWLDAKG